jgi:hypothetical protein
MTQAQLCLSPVEVLAASALGAFFASKKECTRFRGHTFMAGGREKFLARLRFLIYFQKIPGMVARSGYGLARYKLDHAH